MHENTSSSEPRRWQFSLRTLLLVMLLVCTFFAGRVSVHHELNRAQNETQHLRLISDRANRQAIAARRQYADRLLQNELNRVRLEAEISLAAMSRPNHSTREASNPYPNQILNFDLDSLWWNIEMGMQIDALEHSKRFPDIGIEALPQER